MGGGFFEGKDISETRSVLLSSGIIDGLCRGFANDALRKESESQKKSNIPFTIIKKAHSCPLILFCREIIHLYEIRRRRATGRSPNNINHMLDCTFALEHDGSTWIFASIVSSSAYIPPGPPKLRTTL